MIAFSSFKEENTIVGLLLQPSSPRADVQFVKLPMPVINNIEIRSLQIDSNRILFIPLQNLYDKI